MPCFCRVFALLLDFLVSLGDGQDALLDSPFHPPSPFGAQKYHIGTFLLHYITCCSGVGWYIA